MTELVLVAVLNAGSGVGRRIHREYRSKSAHTEVRAGYGARRSRASGTPRWPVRTSVRQALGRQQHDPRTPRRELKLFQPGRLLYKWHVHKFLLTPLTVNALPSIAKCLMQERDLEAHKWPGQAAAKALPKQIRSQS